MLLSRFSRDVRREILFFVLRINEIEALLSPLFVAGLLDRVQATEAVQGDVIELGTYKGGSTVMIARFFKRVGSKRHIYTCDTFTGHPYNDRFSTIKQRGKKFSDVSVPYVRDKFRRFGVADKITIIKGLFEDTLHKKLGEKRFSLAFIDCDLYDSTKYALNFLYPRIADKAMIVLHDYGSQGWGLTKAVDEYSQQKGLKINLHPIPHIRAHEITKRS